MREEEWEQFIKISIGVMNTLAAVSVFNTNEKQETRPTSWVYILFLVPFGSVRRAKQNKTTNLHWSNHRNVPTSAQWRKINQQIINNDCLSAQIISNTNGRPVVKNEGMKEFECMNLHILFTSFIGWSSKLIKKYAIQSAKRPRGQLRVP